MRNCFCLDGMLEDYMKSQSFKPIWKLVKEHDNVLEKRPCMRGGHQMCIDSAVGIVFLLGGWDGYKDLSDLWSFNIATATWHCIATNVEEHVILFIFKNNYYKMKCSVIIINVLYFYIGWSKSSIMS